MRVFVTGATGFVGEGVVRELKAAGHTVVGLARSDEAAEKLRTMGAEPHAGDLADLDSLAAGARANDGVIHLGFIHDFTKFAENMTIDREAVVAMTAAMEGTGKPFVGTSGFGFIGLDRPIVETDAGPDFGRLGTEHILLATGARGVRASVVRLPQVHGPKDHGFVPQTINAAREKGVAAYIGEGKNRWPAVHRDDAARLYRLALETAPAGTRVHAVAEGGITARAIAEVVGEGLGIPVRGLTPEEAQDHFGWFMMFAAMDTPASSAITRKTFDWTPTGPDLLTDMREGDYFR